MTKAWDPAAAREIVAAHAALEGPLLPILHAFIGTFGCVPEEATAFLAHELNLTRAEVHGVISFYHDFRRAAAGRVVVKVCRAEACQAMGGRQAGAALLKHLAIAWNQTTRDGAVTVAPVYCLGLCAAAPAALIGDAPAARLDGARLIDLVEAAR